MDPTEDQTTAALRTVFYEMKQLCEATRLVTETPEDCPEHNAFLESELIHVRVLRDFFEKDERHMDDVLCGDYDYDQASGLLDQEYIDRLHKDLAHLTYDRNTRPSPDEKDWPPEKVVLKVVKEAVRFINHVPEERLAKTPEKTLDNWQSLLDKLNELARELSQSSSPGTNTTS